MQLSAIFPTAEFKSRTTPTRMIDHLPHCHLLTPQNNQEKAKKTAEAFTTKNRGY
jgi:hypothetical protein